MTDETKKDVASVDAPSKKEYKKREIFSGIGPLIINIQL
tara:strand:- start:415 stop:531 length:117 start_codon:yes stop_codon:yes gene_type:complete